MSVKSKFPPVVQQSPTEEIIEKVNKLGLREAASLYGTSKATLSRWLKAQNYQIKRIYVKQEEQAS